MAKYIAKRLLYVVFVFFIVSIIMFIVHKFTPGDPIMLALQDQMQSGGLKAEQFHEYYERQYKMMGFDKPLPVQYARWIGRLLKGDLGYSLSFHRPVKEIVAPHLVNTIKLNVWSTLIVFLITIPLGVASAVKKGSVFDQTVQIVTIIGYSLPTFIFAILFIFLFAVTLQWFPVSGMETAGIQLTDASGLEIWLDRLKHMALPIITLTFISLGGLTRYVRTTMIEALSEDYIRTARAKGLREKTVIYSHAFRNALIPFITVLTGWIIGLFAGSIITETMYNYSGIGKLLYDALRRLDYDVVMSMNMIYVLMALAGNLIMDILYAVADPRVRYN